MTLLRPCSLVRMPRTSFGATAIGVDLSVLPYATAGIFPAARRRLASPFPDNARASAARDGSWVLVAVAVMAGDPSLFGNGAEIAPNWKWRAARRHALETGADV